MNKVEIFLSIVMLVVAVLIFFEVRDAQILAIEECKEKNNGVICPIHNSMDADPVLVMGQLPMILVLILIAMRF